MDPPLWRVYKSSGSCTLTCIIKTNLNRSYWSKYISQVFQSCWQIASYCSENPFKKHNLYNFLNSWQCSHRIKKQLDLTLNVRVSIIRASFVKPSIPNSYRNEITAIQMQYYHYCNCRRTIVYLSYTNFKRYVCVLPTLLINEIWIRTDRRWSIHQHLLLRHE